MTLKATQRAEIYTKHVVEEYRGGGNWSDAVDILRVKPAVVLLVPNGIAIPSDVGLALDKTVEVGAIRPVHLAAAVKAYGGIAITLDDAKELLSYPPIHMFQALRPGRSVGDALARLAAVFHSERKPETSVSTLGVEDLTGFGDAREWALGLAEDIRAWDDGTLDWGDVDCGLLLSGPPGTGKTMFAAAVAKTCGTAFISSSFAQWQAMGHLGDLLKAMRRTFKDAAEKAPCILFLDEFDSLGDRSTFGPDHASYNIQVVNALLEALDGSSRRNGVVVIAATNHPDAIDPALTRPGRLDRHVKIELPDYDARKKILVMHLRAEMPAEILETTARATSGMSGAKLAQLAKDARMRARRARREMTPDDLKAVTPATVVLDPAVRHSVCVHEAGHAVVGTDLGVATVRSIVVPREVGSAEAWSGFVEWSRPVARQRSKEAYRNEIALLLGGRAAEEVMLDDIRDGSGGAPGSDLHRATDLATVMEATLGMGQGLSYSDVSSPRDLEELRRADPVLRRRVGQLLNAELERAKEIVRRRKGDIESLVRALSDSEILDAEEVRALLGFEPGDPVERSRKPYARRGS
ncbi:AAA family ATPase [Rhizobium sp. BK376]|uniref:AAA family ATPase n=1 Tax=Rhizobium sp. BK376 TaxID=2512149 RepID=UPI001FDEE37C|nr:AAA family ATPase [Rhizobium sp. BK376]